LLQNKDKDVIDTGRRNYILEQSLENIREPKGKRSVNADLAKVNPKEKLGIPPHNHKIDNEHVISREQPAGPNSSERL